MDYRRVRLECADNGGFILRYEEVTKNSNPGNTYGCMDYKDKDEIFPAEKGPEALARLEELSGKKKAANPGPLGEKAAAY